MPPGLRDRLDAWGIQVDPELLSDMRQRALREVPDGAHAIDLAQMSAPDLRRWLNETSVVRLNETLDVWWPADGVAARMDRRSLVDGISDWWCPSQDDLIIAAGADRLLIHHEETAYLWSSH